ncbi:MAG: hypothetical protein AB3N16_00630 [Flavobacteriaceae bacterium]
MKYCPYLLLALWALFLVSCTKSNDAAPEVEEPDRGIEREYLINLVYNGEITVQSLTVDATEMEPSAETPRFDAIPVPDLVFREGASMSFSRATGNCDAEFYINDYGALTTASMNLFGDLEGCSLSVTAVAHGQNTLFTGYGTEDGNKANGYYVRISRNGKAPVDVALDKKPIMFAPMGGKLFVLTHDVDITDENGLSVIDLGNHTLLHEQNLGYGAQKIFAHPQGSLIIGYEELHTKMDPGTYSVTYVNYGEDTRPDFVKSTFLECDAAGKLYYALPYANAKHSVVPAVFDFSSNTTTIYKFENFLTEEQMDTLYNIERATMVAYDGANNLILIGYRKAGDLDSGGIIRIKPVPEPAFVDHINVPGVPYNLFVRTN